MQHVITFYFFMARSHYSRPTPAVQTTPCRSYATAYFIIFIISYVSDIILVIGKYFQNLRYLKRHDYGHALSALNKKP